MQGFFRTFGLMFSSFHSAFRVCAFFVPNMIQYVGYMIPVTQMKRWLFWIVRFLHAVSSMGLTTRVLAVLHQPFILW